MCSALPKPRTDAVLGIENFRHRHRQPFRSTWGAQICLYRDMSPAGWKCDSRSANRHSLHPQNNDTLPSTRDVTAIHMGSGTSRFVQMRTTWYNICCDRRCKHSWSPASQHPSSTWKFWQLSGMMMKWGQIRVDKLQMSGLEPGLVLLSYVPHRTSGAVGMHHLVEEAHRWLPPTSPLASGSSTKLLQRGKSLHLAQLL